MPLLFIIIYILIEITFFSLIGDALGTLPMIMLVIAGFFVGSYLIRTTGAGMRQQFMEMQTGLRGANGGRKVSDSLAHFLAGFLIILPGFLTDALGALIWFRPTRQFLAKFLNIQTLNMNASSHTRPDEDIIEGEIIEDEPRHLK